MNNQYNIPSQNEGGQSSPDILSELIGKLISSQAASASVETPTEAPADTKTDNAGSQNSNPFGDLLSTALSNPELLTKLPSMISAAKPIIEMLSQSGKEKETPSVPAVSQASGKNESISKNSYDKRTALLCAMKPYLSVDRQNTIDYIVKLSRLGDILKTL